MTIAPLRFSVSVKTPPARSFQLFAEHIGLWWPKGKTIGAPVGDTDVTIAEDGELLIAGRGLATGYWDDPELTAARFPVVDGRRVYRTGDRVSMDNGELHFPGRLDRQVKIRGYRVEPAAVDETLRRLGAVADSWTFGAESGGGTDGARVRGTSGGDGGGWATIGGIGTCAVAGSGGSATLSSVN